MANGRKTTPKSADPGSKQIPERRLSLLIMCRNEENRIQNALKSAMAIADEIVIFDTGSTDKTIEKVLEACPNAQVHKGKFTNFVESYNVALKHVNTSHVLMFAADEVIADQRTSRAIREYFNAGGNRLDMMVKDFDASGRFQTEMIRNRLFPTSKRYVGPYTHEYIPTEPGERVDVLPSNLYIRHCPSKTKEQERARMEQDIVVLKQYIEDNRKEFKTDLIRANFYLHKSYTVLGQYDQAKPYADAVRGFLVGQNSLFINQIDFDETHTLYERTRDLEHWRKTAQRNYSCPAISAMYGMTAMEEGKPEIAKEALKRAIALPRTEQTKLLADNPMLCLDLPLGALAEIAYKEGNVFETSMYLNILAVVNPVYREQLRSKLTAQINW